MPITKSLAYSWYGTLNILFRAIADFIALAHDVCMESLRGAGNLSPASQSVTSESHMPC